MKAIFTPSALRGTVSAPPSKSMAHRFLLGAALSGQSCTLSGVELSDDIKATIGCLRSLGADISIENDTVRIASEGFMKNINRELNCIESGSTLRFFIPLALCTGQKITFRGSERLMSRPLEVYRNLCRENGFIFQQKKISLTLKGTLQSGSFKLDGSVSSQFITGLIFALVYLGEDSSIEIIPPFESRPYVDLTISALSAFGADVRFSDKYKIEIKRSQLHSYNGKIEGDYSNAAFLDAFNCLGSEIKITNLDKNSLQGDRIYKEYFEKISEGSPSLDISDCPDLGPVLFALSAIKNGAVFTGTDRLKAKESDRVTAMQEELRRLGGTLIIGNNTVTVPQQTLKYSGEPLYGHNDHRIVMAMSVILSVTGGEIDGAEAVSKSYPGFFDDIKKLGAKVELI